MPYGYVINSDPLWFKRFKIEAVNNSWIVHFQISGKQPAKIVDYNTYLFHRIFKTNKVLGYSRINEIGYLTLNNAIKRFGIQKLGYNSIKDLTNSASTWSTTFSNTIFYEKLEDLDLCVLDLNKDLLNKFKFNFGNPPSNLPTVGKTMPPSIVEEILDYLQEGI